MLRKSSDFVPGLRISKIIEFWLLIRSLTDCAVTTGDKVELRRRGVSRAVASPRRGRRCAIAVCGVLGGAHPWTGDRRASTPGPLTHASADAAVPVIRARGVSRAQTSAVILERGHGGAGSQYAAHDVPYLRVSPGGTCPEWF